VQQALDSAAEKKLDRLRRRGTRLATKEEKKYDRNKNDDPNTKQAKIVISDDP
jgi:hypothetical protein